MEKILVLYSGGLDSRLTIKILQEQGFDVEAVHFVLPFGCSGCNLLGGLNSDDVKVKVFDVKREPLLSEYLNIIKSPRHGVGSGINPCKDCKVFMLKKAKEYADEKGIKVIATGEVLGQRPMSQISSAMKIIDDDIGFEVLRPLCAKNLNATSFEKDGVVDREKLFGISGRGRKEQIKLAEKYKIKYPSPGGGCLLCEKLPALRLKRLLDKSLINEESLPLTIVGRHFFINGNWFVVARDAKESAIVATFKNHIPDEIGKPAVYYSDDKSREKAVELQDVYSTGHGEEERNKFEEYRI